AETTYTFSVVSVNEIGRSTPSSRRSAVPRAWDVKPPFATLSAFVDRQWSDLVARPPSSAEHDLWLERLRAGTHLPGDVVAFLRRSNDHRRAVDPVVRLYGAYFERLPDPAGLEYWAARRRSGTTIDQVSQSFAASTEFRTLYGTLDDREFVRRVYRNVLGREGDAAGVDYWTAELDAGRRTRGAVMAGFSESVENREARAATVDVAVLHIEMLGRRPTAVELDAGIEDLEGGLPLATYATRIHLSQEYRDLVSA
ncbi:MAG TPA: DUF4214 domain-containing protein, partial [Iamia sp.]